MLGRMQWIWSAGFGMATASMAMLVLAVVAGPSMYAQSQPLGDPQSCDAPGHQDGGENGPGHAEHGEGYGLGHCDVGSTGDGSPDGTSGEGGSDDDSDVTSLGSDEPESGDEGDDGQASSDDAVDSDDAVSAAASSGGVVGGSNAAADSGDVVEGGSESVDGGAVEDPADDAPVGGSPTDGQSGTEPAVGDPFVVDPPVRVGTGRESGIEPPGAAVEPTVAGEVLAEAEGPILEGPQAPAALPNTGSGGLADVSPRRMGTALAVAGAVAALWVGLMAAGRRISGGGRRS